MGTNYYVKLDPCPHCGRGAGELHIGKSSAGWEFLFMAHPGHGLTSWAAWQAFIQGREGGPIVDEYGEVKTLDWLRELVERKQGLWNSETAPAESWGPFSREGAEYSDAEGYRFSNREFS